jgi:hypothetical protein
MPVAMVLRAESVFDALVSSVGDDTILGEVNFAGLIINTRSTLLSVLLPIR